MLRWLTGLAFCCVLCAFAATAVVSGRQRSASPSPETATLSQGWTALAGGDVSRAAALASQALVDFPQSPAVLSFAVETDLARGGRLAGLDTYERWLGQKKVDAPYVLRRIALAHLRASGSERQAGPARIEALKALVADGDPEAQRTLSTDASSGGIAETTALASAGDKRAVNALIGQLGSPNANRAMVIRALAETGSTQAIEPLLGMLRDERPDVRAAAAEALGRLGARDAVDRIKPLLEDSTSMVRLAAAGALYRLDDMSGLPFLQSLLNSQYPAVRLGAADVMSSHPDAQWQAVTRELTQESDPIVRLGGARLIAPYDRELAASTLQSLLEDGNMAIREEAGRILSQNVANDFASLRRLLRSADRLSSVRAAARIVELTR